MWFQPFRGADSYADHHLVDDMNTNKAWETNRENIKTAEIALFWIEAA
jgi:hypothetical protein